MEFSMYILTVQDARKLDPRIVTSTFSLLPRDGQAILLVIFEHSFDPQEVQEMVQGRWTETPAWP